MDWTDTLILESSRQSASLDGQQIEEGNSIKAVSARVVAVQGISLLHASGSTLEELAAALEILRGFRATGRRVVLCDSSSLAVGRQLGRALVEDGAAEALVSCGSNARELAIGARDAGLGLANVIVCRDVRGACEALLGRLGPGDTVLLWGVDQATCNQLVLRLDKRLSNRIAAAA